MLIPAVIHVPSREEELEPHHTSQEILVYELVSRGGPPQRLPIASLEIRKAPGVAADVGVVLQVYPEGVRARACSWE